MSQKANIYLGVNALIIKESKILLLRRTASIYGGGSWCLPAGHVDGNETLRQAMARELLEELGVTVAPDNIDFVHVSHSKGTNREYAGFYFVVHAWSGELRNMEPDKHDQLEWFNVHSLPENLLCRKIIQDWWLDKRTYSEEGW